MGNWLFTYFIDSLELMVHCLYEPALFLPVAFTLTTVRYEQTYRVKARLKQYCHVSTE